MEAMRNLRALALGALLLAAPTAHAQPADRPWMNTSLPAKRRAEFLVHAMTLDEKILQIHMLDVREHPREVAAIPRLRIPPFRITNGPVGAGPGDTRQTQPATAMPSAIALAAAWDPQLAGKYGALVAREVIDHGDDLLEGPGVNIARIPQNGRNFEYFGEDPYLAGRLAVAEIRAIQNEGVIAEVKHFAANSQEKDRKTINEIIDERTLREIYLPAFEAAVTEGGVDAVMAAYPSVNGNFCSQNPQLLHDILRRDWGFQGFVQSDYTGTHDAVKAGLAGLDLAMKPEHYAAEMKAAIAAGRIPETAVDDMVLRRFTQMFRSGIFDHPKTPQPVPARADGRAAREIAERTAVLLKNEGQLLPLDPARLRSIALIGPYARAAHTGGRGSSAVRPTYTVAPRDGLAARLGKSASLEFSSGADPAAAAAAAKSADVAIVMVGNTDSEGRDRPNLSLPNGQDALIAAVAAANPRTIVVLKTGGAVLMPWLEKVPAVLEAWYPGQEDGNVVAALLFGEAGPEGRLPVTFPPAENEVPASTPRQYPGVGGDATYSERLLVGYRWYDDRDVAPLFPFGFGLSYTNFALGNLTVSAYSRSRAIEVAVDVRNTGSREGAEVVQVYVAGPREDGEPPRQLRGFAKVRLAAGAVQRVAVTLDPRAFSIWDSAAGRWTAYPGEYCILAGTSSRELPLQASISVPAPPPSPPSSAGH
jgi:beta-glucosidase